MKSTKSINTNKNPNTIYTKTIAKQYIQNSITFSLAPDMLFLSKTINVTSLKNNVTPEHKQP